MSKAFVTDVAKCNGCYVCQLVCKDEHAGNDWTPYAKPQPDIGQFWMKVRDHVNGTIPKVKVHYIPQMCNHCRNAFCMAACPVSGAVYRRDDGLIIIDPEKCNGCRACEKACPYEAIYFNEELNIAQKCTGCAHLLDNGIKLPRCVEACATACLSFGEEEELSDLIKGAEVMLPETGAGPRVYYRNIPGKFIAGTLFDAVEREVIIGARCLAVTGGKLIETVTDEFGDFWFKDLPVGAFDLSFEALGFERLTMPGIRTDESVCLGDIALEKSR
ncbi:MAG: 4Fe-4S dicluster domain-containing protein [Oscillospiraceae bacterium]|nr:4Fe-4S dicluster domain-containing protein [Oscillospiraceae bacterium]